MDLRVWLERQAPDFIATFQRFPFAILLAALNTAIVIGSINEVVWLRDEVWARAALGLSTAAVCAVGGVYFRESRPESHIAGMVLTWLLPLVAIGLFQVTDIAWVVPWALPVISILWLSVSPFTRVERGGPREEQQNRFWWVNHQAVTTAVIGGVGFLLIALGLFAIERSLSVLFGLSTGDLFYKWVLPFAGLFLTPVYWLSTLPRLSAFSPEALEKPEFLSRAVGFLGQFVLVPLLLIYSLILLAYTAQIVATQHLPQGMIGWMVLGFVVIGAATWLVLHPPFMRERVLVRFFRRWWFWLTLVPLGLFFVAVYIRVDAYGFTDERMLLLAGGVWAALLAAAFLFRRGDIRLIPALAGVLLLLLSLGPWNYAHLPMTQQLGRLDAVVFNAGADKSASPPRANWSPEEVAEARGSIDYLIQSREGRKRVRELFGRYGVTWSPDQDGAYVIFEALGQDMGSDPEAPRFVTVRRDLAVAVDVSATPFYLQSISVYGSGTRQVVATLRWRNEAVVPDSPESRIDPYITLRDGHLVIETDAGAADTVTTVDVDLSTFAARQPTETLVEPWIDFTYGGTNYRIAVESATLDRETGDGRIDSLQGQLFASAPTPSP